MIDSDFDHAARAATTRKFRRRRGVELIAMTVMVTPETYTHILKAAQFWKVAQGAVVDKWVKEAVRKVG